MVILLFHDMMLVVLTDHIGETDGGSSSRSEGRRKGCRIIGHFLRVENEHTKPRASLGEHTRCFRADFSGSANVNHGCAFLRLGMAVT